MKTRMTLLILVGLLSNIGYAQVMNVQQASYKQKPIIEMTLNNKKIWVLLDTGTDISILDVNTKDEFGFATFINTDTRYKVPGFGSENNQLHQVTKADLRFGNTHLKRKVYAFDISNITKSIKARTGKKISAIIGTNMMSSYGFIIDMGTNTVTMKTKDKNKNNYIAASTNSN